MIALVTGSTDGIGRQTALELARRGWRVLVHGRNPERSEAAVNELRSEAGSVEVEAVSADFASMHAVREMAQEIAARLERLDVLINNAGVYMPRRELTPDGLETTFAVNHLAHFLLTRSLLDLLKRSRPARIINVSSGTHFGARLDFDNLQGEKRYGAHNAYALSKLANVLFSNRLARDLAGSGVTANSLHPGAIGTKLLRAGYGGGGRGLEAGARTPVYLATAPQLEGVTGRYFVDMKATSSAPESTDVENQDRLWDVSERLVAEALKG